MLKKLWPSHHTRRGIWSHKVRAGALGEGTNFFAHVDTDPSELVLKLRTVLQVICGAGLRIIQEPCRSQWCRQKQYKEGYRLHCES